MIARAINVTAGAGVVLAGIQGTTLLAFADVPRPDFFVPITPEQVKAWIPVLEMLVVTMGSAMLAVMSKMYSRYRERKNEEVKSVKSDFREYFNKVEERLAEMEAALGLLAADMKVNKELLTKNQQLTEQGNECYQDLIRQIKDARAKKFEHKDKT